MIDGKIIYQIYPRSFYDSTKSGTGDLTGIEDKLDYVASLGVDYVWLSPFFTSPMKDFGYDVADYCNVDPIFGDLSSFDRLVEKANKLNLKVMIDMVISHSSDQHPWFLESCRNIDNDKSDWYVWVDAKKGAHSLPNNWLSVFGNSSWQYHEGRNQFYLHNFLVSQPDLNFHNLAVQEAMLGVCEFWMKRGIKGIRLDTVNFYFHDLQLRDNPLHSEHSTALDSPGCNPYIKQNHLYDKNRPENINFLIHLRKLANQYDVLLLGEVGADQETAHMIKNYTTGNDKLHLCYGFDYIGGPFSVKYYCESINNFWGTPPKGMICNSFGNHDSVRWISRWEHNNDYDLEFTKLCASLLMFLKGACCIYQGEELGLSEYEITKKEDIKDPYGLAFFPEFKGRDGCRTPMVWQKDALNGGFSSAPKTWLPVPEEHLAKAVDQQNEPDSLLNFYRQLIIFKKNNEILQSGDIQAEPISKNLLRIIRTGAKGDKLEGIFNFSDTKLSINKSNQDILWPNNNNNNNRSNELGPYGVVIRKI